MTAPVATVAQVAGAKPRGAEPITKSTFSAADLETVHISAFATSDTGHNAELRLAALTESVLAEPRELTRQLNAVFSAPITSKLAGYQDPKIAYRWARTDGPKPAREALRRLHASNRIWSEVAAHRSYAQATAWFQAPHPALDGKQPVALMMQNRFAEVSAVSAFQNESPASLLKRSKTDVDEVTALWHEASLAPLLDVIKFLAERFGAPSVVLLAREANTKAVYRWIRNEGRLPSGAAAMSLYGVYRAVIALDDIFPAASVQAWIVAANRSLGELSPLDVARNGDAQSFIDAADRLLFPINQVRNNR